MTPWVRLVENIASLAPVAGEWVERWDFLNAHGEVTPELLQRLTELMAEADRIGPDIFALKLDGELYDLESLRELRDDTADVLPGSWHLQLPKAAMLRAANVQGDQKSFLFFSHEAFAEWSSAIDLYRSGDLLEGRRTTVLVADISTRFGGPRLRVGPPGTIFEDLPEGQSFPILPDSPTVHKLIHVIDPGMPRLDPAAFVLTYGDRDSEEARPFLVAACRILAACLANDLFFKEDRPWVLIRGIRRMEWPLVADGDPVVDAVFQDQLVEAIQWVYENNSDTRHALLADRLSIDVAAQGSFLAGIRPHLGTALRQAKERFVFVVRDRKDEYHKELREVLKDVRAQADLYAAKVRQLVNALLRDALSVLVVLGVGLIARTPPGQLKAIAVSPQVQLFFKVLAGYFVVSILLQAASHGRDIWLAWKESNVWREKMRNYMSGTELEETFHAPLERRRTTFFVALFIDVVLYLGLAIGAWQFAEVVGYLSATLP